ncbi:hypothetical protein [Citricoccus alkalitolerans]|uniref:Uncharacterized protein n=1 Tax=Citricoccus alkalitolerans TaxID=246603 RepID=A0ABV8Y0B9_9MICC
MSRFAKGLIVFWVIYALLAAIGWVTGVIDGVLAVLFIGSAACGIMVGISNARAKKRSRSARTVTEAPE